MDESGMECPDIEFAYSDADTHMNELAELYSYTEQPEYQLNVKAFEDLMVEYKLSPCWEKLNEEQKLSVIMKLLDQLEVSSKVVRMKAARCFLYIAQGCWAEVQSDEEQQQMAKCNVMLLYDCGVFGAFVDLLNIEIENSTAASTALRKLAVSLADSTDLRVVLSVLYIMVEVMRSVQDDDKDEIKERRDSFRADLGSREQKSEHANKFVPFTHIKKIYISHMIIFMSIL